MNRKLSALLLISLLLASAALRSETNNEYKWGGIASLNIGVIKEKALSFISEKMPQLKGTQLIFLEASTQYRERNNKFNLKAIFYHKNSYVSGSELKQIVTMSNGKKELVFIKVEYLIIHFDKNGKPYKHELINEQFPGSKEEFEEYIQNSNK